MDQQQQTDIFGASSSSSSSSQGEEEIISYPEDFNNLWDWCLQMHYKCNRHHPEHFKNPESEMTLEDRIELTCDLLGSVKGHALTKNIDLSLSECRAVIESQKWPKWKYALLDQLPPASKTIPQLPPRWKKFPEEEKQVLKKFYLNTFVVKKESPSNSSSSSSNGDDDNCKKIGFSNRRKLFELNLKCIPYYMKDLYWHKVGVNIVFNQIPEFQVPGMESRILSHDKDKYKIEMIVGYTSKWCFD